MNFVFGTLVLLAAAPFLVETASQHPPATMDLAQVVQNCFKKANIACNRLVTYMNNVQKGIVGKDNGVICFLACLEVDSQSMFPGEPFYLPNYNRWFDQSKWAAIAPGVTKCTSGRNMNIKNVCDRELDYMNCLRDNKLYQVLNVKIPPIPPTCK